MISDENQYVIRTGLTSAGLSRVRFHAFGILFMLQLLKAISGLESSLQNAVTSSQYLGQVRCRSSVQGEGVGGDAPPSPDYR